MTVFGRRGRVAVNAAGAVALAVCLALFTAAEAAAEPNGASSNPSVSPDGRYVAYTSLASNVSLDEDTNGVSDVFVRDRKSGITTRVSISTSGAQADGPSRKPSISDDGRYVAFESEASNLVPADTNGGVDVFVHDLATGETHRASVDSTGGELYECWATGPEPSSPTEASATSCGLRPGYQPAISGDGRFVAFVSQQKYVIPEADNFSGNDKVYVYDRTAGRTIEDVTVRYGGGSSGGSQPALSRDGRYVAFGAWQSDLVPGDTNGTNDVFVRDRSAQTTTRVSVSSTGAQANNSSSSPSISDDGRYVAFSSNASNLITKDPRGVSDSDTNGLADVFRHDRATRATVRVSGPSASYEPNGASARPSVSADGQLVVFESNVTNQACCDTNKATDVYQFTQGNSRLSRVSVDDRRPEANGPSTEASVSGDGTYAAYATSATTLFAQDTNGVADIGLHTWVSSLPAASASARAETERPAEACGEGRRRAPGGGGRHIHRRVHRHRNGRRHVHRRVHFHGRRAEGREVGAALTSGWCVVSRESEENREDRKKARRALRLLVRERSSDNVEHLLRRCDEPIYHYTDPTAAATIYGGAPQTIFASPARQGEAGTFPIGAYASKLWPERGQNWDGRSYTQSTLSSHLFGDSTQPSSAWVLLCRSDTKNSHFKRTDYQVTFDAPDDYWHAPATSKGDPVTIEAEGWGDNGMDP